MSSSSNNSKITTFNIKSKGLFIPFQVIEKATKNFTIVLGKGGYGSVYKGKLLLSGEPTSVAVKRLDSSHISGQVFQEMLKEIKFLYRYKHPNVVSFLGFCDEAGEKILVYEYAEHGSLDQHLPVAKTTHPLTWDQRISICLDIACALVYLHNHIPTGESVIHKDIKSPNILIGGNWKAMIADLGLSKLGRADEGATYIITTASLGYCDPEYFHTGILTKESDVYSFGVVMFEVLCGRLGFMNINNEHRFLARLAQRYYEAGRLNEIIDPYLKIEVDSDFLKRFSEIAYPCLLSERDRRPSMRLVVQKLEELMASSKSSSSNSKITAFIKESKHLFIPFQVIENATKNFTTILGNGGYGIVYKGELLLSGELTSVAVKRLDSKISGQGFKEFLTEIQLLSRYRHPNLVSLLGFCDEAGEKILIYEYADHGSLDKHLTVAKITPPLTWERRLSICRDTARGLDYLHNGIPTNHQVIHRDIKSANILIGREWKAMIADLGLSKIGLANEDDSYQITNAAGTPGYCDPAYMDTGFLTKESDVYSFGVVMFEVLCGRLGFMSVNNEHRFLARLAQSYYITGRLNEIIDPYIKIEVDSDSLKRYSEIAYSCLLGREQRPSMGLVVQKLEEMMASSKGFK